MGCVTGVKSSSFLGTRRIKPKLEDNNYHADSHILTSETPQKALPIILHHSDPAVLLPLQKIKQHFPPLHLLSIDTLDSAK